MKANICSPHQETKEKSLTVVNYKVQNITKLFGEHCMLFNEHLHTKRFRNNISTAQTHLFTYNIR